MSRCSDKQLDDNELREAVSDHYGKILEKSETCKGKSCFGISTDSEYALQLGYSKDEFDSAPTGANLGLGCGNPLVFANLKEGDIVVDLGSGAGFDAFIAARKIGTNGKVIGVDMTPQMISKARENAKKSNVANVEFRLGEIEHLPVGDNLVDVIISNCVINLVPECHKQQVFKEAFRVLKHGGRICISDVVSSVPLPEILKSNVETFTGCLYGATLMEDMKKYLEVAGFKDIKITTNEESKKFIKAWDPKCSVTDFIVSALIRGNKP